MFISGSGDLYNILMVGEKVEGWKYFDGGMFMDKEKLQELLKGKTIERADLSHGTVKLFFNDGTCFKREKTCEGVIMASLFGADGKMILSARI